MMESAGDPETVAYPESHSWRGLYRLSAFAAGLFVATVVAEILVTFLPGGGSSPETVVDWFSLLQSNWFMGMRNLGLLNVVMTTLGIPIYLALYSAHRHTNGGIAALAMVTGYIGIAVFLGTNRAFPMLDLSGRYAEATSDAQRATLEAAGMAMLSVGQSHTPGTFIGFFLGGLAGILISVVMLKGGVFGKPAAYAGIVSFSLLLFFDICASFVPSIFDVVMFVAMIGGVLSMVWYVLVARRLLQLSRT